MKHSNNTLENRIGLKARLKAAEIKSPAWVAAR